MANTDGDEVRITGLRLQGTSRSTAEHQPGSIGVYAHDDLFVHAIVDHNDISDWTWNGVRAGGNENPRIDTFCDPSESGDPQARSHKTFVLRNFIHHNRMQEFGYGVEANTGGYPFIEGNTFVSNRHAIAAGWGTAHSGYRAWGNVVLSDAPLQHAFIDFFTHDFDMHGTNRDGFGGRGGDYVDMFRNTFLGTNRHNYELRGIPCNSSNYHANVSLESEDDAVNFKDSSTQLFGSTDHINIASNPNQFGFANPTNRLGVGDFDGDGYQDVFLATGTAWYFAPRANAEWRFLSTKTEKIDQVLLGDFDGDGRTDVVAIHNGQFVVCWAGISDWEVLSADPTGGRLYLLPSAVTAMAVGDFDGDGIADIFWADTTTWWVAYSGNNQFVLVQTSSFGVNDLRFGDFDGNGTTDVFGVVNGRWMVSYSPRLVHQLFSSWTPLPVSLTTTVDGLVVADFNGDGIADVAKMGMYAIPWSWMFSYGGAAGWTSHQIVATTSCSLTLTVGQVPGLVAIGPFAGNPGADILLWGGNIFCIVPGGTGDAQRQSRQDMR
jgi:hypothetical protein